MKVWLAICGGKVGRVGNGLGGCAGCGGGGKLTGISAGALLATLGTRGVVAGKRNEGLAVVGLG